MLETFSAFVGGVLALFNVHASIRYLDVGLRVANDRAKLICGLLFSALLNFLC